ncbi:hypothetical protein BHE74_00001929 [Ensete ventricosum]|nr:hypothetical protein GW17_00037650 [Ensete ventricosum]RWW89100.1 hypothetical protein BHE74_00001929 [Ensete ventricosum]RZR76429.1 hypothetical protein BHM03_00001177 [Ensete ventricosum]
MRSTATPPPGRTPPSPRSGSSSSWPATAPPPSSPSPSPAVPWTTVLMPTRTTTEKTSGCMHACMHATRLRKCLRRRHGWLIMASLVLNRRWGCSILMQ